MGSEGRDIKGGLGQKLTRSIMEESKKAHEQIKKMIPITPNEEVGIAEVRKRRNALLLKRFGNSGKKESYKTLGEGASCRAATDRSVHKYFERTDKGKESPNHSHQLQEKRRGGRSRASRKINGKKGREPCLFNGGKHGRAHKEWDLKDGGDHRQRWYEGRRGQTSFSTSATTPRKENEKPIRRAEDEKSTARFRKNHKKRQQSKPLGAPKVHN